MLKKAAYESPKLMELDGRTITLNAQAEVQPESFNTCRAGTGWWDTCVTGTGWFHDCWSGK